MKRAVAAILINNNKVLIGKKVIKEGHFCSGGWHLPGGGIKLKETEEEALIREYKEETNLDIRILKRLVTYYVPDNDSQVTFFIAEPITNNLIPGDDITQAKFVDIKDSLKIIDPRAIKYYSKEVINFLKGN